MRQPARHSVTRNGVSRRASLCALLAVLAFGPFGAGTASAMQSGAVPKPVKASATGSSSGDPRLDELEHLAIDHVNGERRAIGVSDLIVSPELSRIAREYCRDMAERRFFAHLDPDGKMVYDRAARGGVSDWTNIAENIARNRGFDDPAGVAVREWMKSEGHRDNILDARFVETGLGAWVGPDRTVYFAQIFIRRPKKR
ncbi:MAG: CAP domain-containing protein [Acidobacteria bacterium]|nr:CAP domain-containing protein [Acidobacteriota bacterium]